MESEHGPVFNKMALHPRGHTLADLTEVRTRGDVAYLQTTLGQVKSGSITQ